MAQMTKIEEQTTITCDPNKLFDFLKSDIPHITKITAEPTEMNYGPLDMGHGGSFKMLNGATNKKPLLGSTNMGTYDYDTANYMSSGQTNGAHGRIGMAHGRTNMANYDSVHLAPRMMFDEPTKPAPRMFNEPAKLAPRGLNNVAKVDNRTRNRQDAGVKQFELFIFGEKITVKLKPEVTNEQNKSITFTMIHEDSNKRNTVFMVKVSIKNNTIVWSLQNAGAIDASPTVIFIAKMAIDLIIRALDGYLKSV